MKNRFDIPLAIFLLLPFVVISWFNHPLGDDYWISSLVRKGGIIEAQKSLYHTVSARFTSLSLMSVNPLVFGNTWLYRLIPVAFMGLLFLTLKFAISAFAGPGKVQGILALILTATYLAVIPGLGEGIYWTSSMVVYQVGLLLFILWLRVLYKNPHKTLPIVILFICTLGSNELIALLATLINLIYLAIRKDHKKVGAICFLIGLPCWWYILFSPSFGTRYNQNVAFGFIELSTAIIKGGSVALYHIGKVLLNPFLWAGILLVWDHLASIPKKAIRISKVQLIFISMALIFLIAAIAYHYSPRHIVPLRISNMLVFLFLFFLLIYAIVYLSGTLNANLLRIKYPLVILLFIAGFFVNTNPSLIIKDLVSGNAVNYHREMLERERLLRECQSDTCVIPTLKYRPVSLRYSTFDNDPHIGEYYNKIIVFKELADK